ncbi:hypothetical protein quinque_015959 [Culex quinquefasciatus]
MCGSPEALAILEEFGIGAFKANRLLPGAIPEFYPANTATNMIISMTQSPALVTSDKDLAIEPEFDQAIGFSETMDTELGADSCAYRMFIQDHLASSYAINDARCPPSFNPNSMKLSISMTVITITM